MSFRNLKLVVATAGLTCLIPGLTLAEPIIEIRTQNQLRENLVGDQELPWLNTFRIDQTLQPLHGGITLYGQILADPLQEESSADLFQASFSWSEPTLHLRGNFGRFLLTTSESVIPLDGAEFIVGTGQRISLRVFGGARRHLEVSNFEDESVLVGLDVRAHPFSITTISLGYRYEDDLEEVSRQWIVAGARQALPILWTPILYGSIHYLADEEIVGAGRVGFEFHPLPSLQVSGEFSRYDEARDGFEWQDRIFSTLARSAEWQIRGATAYVIRKGFTIRGSYGFQSFDVVANPGRNGHLLDLGAGWRHGKWRPWIVDFDGFYQDSYGGEVIGFVGRVRKQITLGWWAKGAIALSGYDKVTGSDDYAFHSGLGVFYRWPWGLEVGLDGEFNSNIDQTRDGRVGIMASYVYF